jgi:hypothetical protein
MIKLLRNRLPVLAVLATIALVAACSPEVGSKEWCTDMDKKAKGDWSANEAKDFAKHCIL